LDSLALLFPDKKEVHRWFKKERKKIKIIDPFAETNRHLEGSARSLHHFKFWGQRISVLKQAFDNSEPQTFLQWWYDDRNIVQWSTFWTAVTVIMLTIIFGLAQTVATCIQAWASLHDLSRKTLDSCHT
jgi:hypothetical protein